MPAKKSYRRRRPKKDDIFETNPYLKNPRLHDCPCCSNADVRKRSYFDHMVSALAAETKYLAPVLHLVLQKSIINRDILRLILGYISSGTLRTSLQRKHLIFLFF